MGYALTLWAVPADDLERLLEHGVERPDALESADSVALWLDKVGHVIDAVDHLSPACDWFRNEVIGGRVAARFGAELAGHLLARPLGGLEWNGCPSVGWVRNAELRAAVPADARAEAPDPETDEDEALQTLTGALVRVLDSGADLVTYYD